MSRTVIDQLKCGACGGEEHTLFRVEEGEHKGDVITRCLKCKTESRITITAPRIAIEWGDNADGVLTGGWS